MNDPAQSSVATPEGAGAILHAERRRQNLSLGDVSRHLKISVRQVEALERDDFGPFAGPVFVHGFIRNYAKLLGIDAEPLVRAADVKLAPPAPKEDERQIVDFRESEKPQARNLAAVGLVAVILIMGFVGFYASKQDDGSAPPTSFAPLRVPPSGQEAENPIQQRMPAAATEPAGAGEITVEQAGEGSAVLRMVFDQESWIEVKDRSGNTIFAQLNPVGARRKVAGDPPLSVVVGNAAGVRLSFNDRDIDLGPHTRVNVARLTLQ